MRLSIETPVDEVQQIDFDIKTEMILIGVWSSV